MFLSEDEFEENRNYISKDKNVKCLMETLTEIRDFLDKFGFLTFGRDVSIIRVSGLINGNIVLDSATRTMESIRYCGMNGNFADAYTLLRKFRDDLFYYVYQLVVADKTDIIKSEKISADEKKYFGLGK